LAEARKSRRVQEELAKKRREELAQLFGICLGIAIFVVGMIGIVYWALWLKGTL
jgi:hypothetical protein